MIQQQQKRKVERIVGNLGLVSGGCFGSLGFFHGLAWHNAQVVNSLKYAGAVWHPWALGHIL